jgi:hypothetical protein
MKRWLNQLFDLIQSIVMRGRTKKDSFKHRYVKYPIALTLYTIFWWFEDPKSLYHHITHPDPELKPEPVKQKTFDEMPSTLTNIEEHDVDSL